MNCARRDVFLLIEPVADYSPLAPVLCARRYGRDCQFNEGHEFGRIPADEILQPTWTVPRRIKTADDRARWRARARGRATAGPAAP